MIAFPRLNPRQQRIADEIIARVLGARARRLAKVVGPKRKRKAKMAPPKERYSIAVRQALKSAGLIDKLNDPSWKIAIAVARLYGVRIATITSGDFQATDRQLLTTIEAAAKRRAAT